MKVAQPYFGNYKLGHKDKEHAVACQMSHCTNMTIGSLPESIISSMTVVDDIIALVASSISVPNTKPIPCGCIEKSQKKLLKDRLYSELPK